MGVSRPDLAAFPSPEAKTSGFRFDLDARLRGFPGESTGRRPGEIEWRHRVHPCEITIKFVL